MPKDPFIDSTPEIDRLWKRVHRPGDIPIAVNMGPVAEGDIPKVLAGYDTASTMRPTSPSRRCARCAGSSTSSSLAPAPAASSISPPRSAGIKVSTIKGYGDTAVAEHAMGLVFAAARHIATMHKIMRDGGWQVMQGMELKGKTLGLVGLGGIGREMARLAKGIGLEVIAYNRTPVKTRRCRWWHRRSAGSIGHREPASRPQRWHARLSRPDAARQAQAGRHPGQHRAGRSGGRGALIDLLRSGQIGHYATDVYAQEPPKPDEPLRSSTTSR